MAPSAGTPTCGTSSRAYRSSRSRRSGLHCYLPGPLRLRSALFRRQATAARVLPEVVIHLEPHVLGQVDGIEIGVEHPVFGHVAQIGPLVSPVGQLRGQARQQSRDVLDDEAEVLEATLAVDGPLRLVAIHLAAL